jgi:hypothetical protein
MTGKKWFLAVAAVAFLGWMAYLGYAVAVHRLSPPDVVSRSQLVAAEYVAVVEVTPGDTTAQVVHRLAGDGPEAKATITVLNLPAATSPANAPLAAGQYLLALVPDGVADPRTGPYRIAGWPRGLGEGTTQPGVELKQTVEEVGADGQPHAVQKPFDPPRYVRPPLAHPWTPAVEAQMRGLGYKW